MDLSAEMNDDYDEQQEGFQEFFDSEEQQDAGVELAAETDNELGVEGPEITDTVPMAENKEDLNSSGQDSFEENQPVEGEDELEGGKVENAETDPIIEGGERSDYEELADDEEELMEMSEDDLSDEEREALARKDVLEVIERLKKEDEESKKTELDSKQVELNEAEEAFEATEELPTEKIRKAVSRELRRLKERGEEISEDLETKAKYGEKIDAIDAQVAFDSDLSKLESLQSAAKQDGKSLSDEDAKHLGDMQERKRKDNTTAESGNAIDYGREKHLYYNLLSEAKKIWPKEYQYEARQAWPKGREREVKRKIFERGFRLPRRWDDSEYSMEEYKSRYEAMRKAKIEHFCKVRGIDTGSGVFE